MISLPQLISEAPLLLMEAAVVERLRRTPGLALHQTLVNAPLIYDPAGREAMAEIYREYMTIATEASLPFLMCTPAWRCNQERVQGWAEERQLPTQSINEDAVRFLQQLRQEQSETPDSIYIGGMLGCKNDCYRPEEALSSQHAETFHAWQIDRLATAGVDFLIAETLPESGEALGIARAMQTTGLPYVISFVIGRDGCILDGHSLSEAIDLIDSGVSRSPLGYMVNCAHPDFLSAETLPGRGDCRSGVEPGSETAGLIGFLANASSLSHAELEASETVKVGDLAHWGRAMMRLNREFGVQVLGGCCGTDARHLRLLAG